MTAARRQQKERRASIAVFALALAILGSPMPPLAAGALTEKVVVDRHTGLAIGGYDPVAFHTDGRAVPGHPDFELQYGGAVWRFCNSGNRAAFAERPDVYMPRFGGYDPVGIAHGVAVAGKPEVWLISDSHLFLFHNSRRLEAFIADARHLTSAAEQKWPAVLQTLSP
jgi:YHS domain-containing protein